MEIPKFERPEDTRSPEEQEKEEERLSAAFQAIIEGDEGFAKELGVKFIEGVEENNKKEVKEQKETFKKEGSARELYFQVLFDKHPDLGIKIEDIVDKSSGKNIEGFYTLSMKISDENRKVLQELHQNKALEFLQKNNFNEKDFEEILDYKILPEEIAVGLLARSYAKEPDKYEVELKNMRVGPISDEELKGIMAEYIDKVILEK